MVGKVKSKKVYINKEVCGESEKKYERRNTKKLEVWQEKDCNVRSEASCMLPGDSGFLYLVEKVNLTFHG